jgi:crotonobetainyl-CoA:carnitine CoA-transferase CaiB-like acyl-CoA transferase
MLSVVGVLTALYHRARTGEGQELWTSLMDGGAVFASDVLIRPDGTPSERPVIDANGYGFGPGYRLYPTQEGWLQVCAVSEAEWTALGAAVGIENDAINTGKRENHTTTLEAAFLTRTALNWSRILDDAGVPNEIAVDTLGGQSLLFDSDNVALGLVADYEHSILGRIRQFGATVNFSDTPGRIFGPPPLVGEHSRQILEDLGYSGSDQEDLRKAGVVYWPDSDYPWGW